MVTRNGDGITLGLWFGAGFVGLVLKTRSWAPRWGMVGKGVDGAGFHR